MLRKLATALTGTVALALAADAALALPRPQTHPGDAPRVEKVHYCHGSANTMRDEYGWHYHAERCRRVDGFPPRESFRDSPRHYERRDYGYDYPRYGYDGHRRWHRHEYGGHGYGRYYDDGPRCERRCKYIGPFKMCKTKCRDD